MINQLKQLANQYPQGFTVDLDLNLITEGFVISVPETQHSFGDEGLKKVLRIAKDNNCCVGGWLNTDNGKFYWDASVIVNDLEKAKTLGRKFGQLAIFDLNEQKVIWL